MKASTLLTLVPVLFACAGCRPVPWRPELPVGKTWSHQALQGWSIDDQGRLERPKYPQLFSSEGYVGPRQGESPGRFWKRINVGTTHLNVRLINEGETVRPGAQGPVVASEVAVPFDEQPTDHAKGSR